jgi:hypothetical protein
MPFARQGKTVNVGLFLLGTFFFILGVVFLIRRDQLVAVRPRRNPEFVRKVVLALAVGSFFSAACWFAAAVLA